VSDLETGYVSDYDLLAVVESPEVAEDHMLWARVRESIRRFALVTALRELRLDVVIF
jgi:hypothetical protein